MSRLLPKPTREVERLLASFGFRFGRHGKEDVWVRDEDGRVVILPRSRGSSHPVPVGTLKAILLQAGISREQAVDFWSR